MAQSLSNVLLHLVFSTKNRKPQIDVGIEEELYRYLVGICRELHCPAHKIGGTDDHVHIACSLSRTIPISELLKQLKASSSQWIKGKDERFRDFSWQNGYGAFSIGQSQLDDLRSYIANQREHHRRISFQEEFRSLLAKYKIDYDERFVWD